MNLDLKMTEPMLNIEGMLPENAQGIQQLLMDNYSEVPNELDPQLAWLVRNLAYQRAISIQQQETINSLVDAVHILVEAVGGCTCEAEDSSNPEV